MPRTPEQYEEIRNEKKHAIMHAAFLLFANQGYTSTSITQVAEKANISKGLMYNYFESKEALLNAIVEWVRNEVRELLDPDHDGAISNEEALEFFDRFFSMLKRRPNLMMAHFQLITQPDVLRYLRKECDGKQDDKYMQMLLEFLARNDPKNAQLKMLNLSVILKGISLVYAFSPELFAGNLLDEYKEYLKDIFVRGIA
ncbi:MAG: TetR/AcrR family transcriptional regulator [Bacteroidales bacterium]|jgi:AcrR family transcriptional regulator|nr:TetR/AcrR family transcriptional regulator [Bacteroidales bacterium]